ncbi:MAG: hypothetical protein D6757_03945 [Alphaproteobacteria bacterium]|nr:MAG: hypothetical protein D6757_03945 [Alphaproteobacteria bacterium]
MRGRSDLIHDVPIFMVVHLTKKERGGVIVLTSGGGHRMIREKSGWACSITHVGMQGGIFRQGSLQEGAKRARSGMVFFHTCQMGALGRPLLLFSGTRILVQTKEKWGSQTHDECCCHL